MDKPSTTEELRSALEGDRYQILKCLATHDELPSSEIRDHARWTVIDTERVDDRVL
jgi:hypothetical protein